MADYDKKYAILKKYYKSIETSSGFDLKEDISSSKLDAAIKKFASGLEKDSVLGFYDTTLMGSGKSGYIFTDSKIYYLETLEKPKKLWYDDIEKVQLLDKEKKDCDRKIMISLYDGTVITLGSVYLNKEPLVKFFNAIIKLIKEPEKAEDKAVGKKKQKKNSGAVAGGIAVETYANVNKSYDEEKFHARQGHGFAAERANNLYDNLTGHDAKIIGDDNAANGADRIVDGVYIQSKYCNTGKACINECFTEDGRGSFRYMMDGKPMQIEVPSDKYEEALAAMEEKIRNGQVNGVTNPEEAKNIVRKGHFTYAQARNIAKAGTIESLTYDSVNGAIIASSAFGVTAVITFASSVWNGEDVDVALKVATYSGLKVGGTAFLTTVIASQLSKAGLNSALVGSSEAVVAFMGPKASAVLINAFRSGSNIYMEQQL